jgi:hypothetical protein
VRTFKLPEITRLNAMLGLGHVQWVLAAFDSRRANSSFCDGAICAWIREARVRWDRYIMITWSVLTWNVELCAVA